MRLIAETQQILMQSGNPESETNNETGLVLGYVQSGKTMSFTTLTALAKDNGYQIIIIIAGIATNLIDQSTTRLEKDLRINERTDRQWLSIKNPTISANYQSISDKLLEWKDKTFPVERRRTILITILKNQKRLQDLHDLLSRLDLKGVPTLIIDDEGDQASLNTQERKNARNARNGEYNENSLSTIYNRIISLKAVLPHHTFVQYTATPQANLFVNIMNRLSPNFIQLLTTGDKYTGGKTFFRDRRDLIEVIPPQDIIATSPPESLLDALRMFFLGVAKGEPQNEFKNRSMMIHPSERTDEHTDFYNWAITIKNEWVDILAKPDTDLSKQALVADFQKSYNKLAQIATDLPIFDQLSGKTLLYAIRGTQIEKLNASRGKTPNVNWRDNYAFILIGGKAMDRGFTVEGLTVTYMPRNIGVGNADTIQQRARFFGYKKGYLNYCRIYINQNAQAAYEDYVVHEEDMRHRLSEHIKTGKPLNDWYREVFLADFLNLTRNNVLFNEVSRSVFGDEWFSIKAPHDAAIPNNQRITEDFIKNNGLNPYLNKSQEYEIVPLMTVVNNLLSKLVYNRRSDFDNFNALKSVLSQYLEERPNELCTVYLFGSLDKPRERKMKNEQINELFQGRNDNYLGDREIRAKRGITFQIHVVTLLEGKNAVAEKLPTIAAYLPSELSQDVIRQTYQDIE
ncbi:MAG: Z1 domain-containing protein [Saprospiraceae bacterium]|nr:Z1 domain-containing protein [Saprospiraceae bacterium]